MKNAGEELTTGDEEKPIDSVAELLTPMVADHPDAVFIMQANLESLEDRQGFEEAGYRIARALFSRRAGAKRSLPDAIIKPNVVTGNFLDKEGRIIPSDGVVTDAHFVGGIARFLGESGFNRIRVAEGGNPVTGEDGEYTMEPAFSDRGYRELADRMGLELVSLNKRNYEADDLVWRSLGDQGIVYKEVPFVRPLPGDFVINVPTLKTHYHAIVTLCGKNLQGAVAADYRRHCMALEGVEKYSPEILAHLQPNFGQEIRRLTERHEREGYWRMDTQCELLAQRTCDTILAFRPQPTINIIEGIRGRDGTAFHHGCDWLTNLVIAGINPVHVDTIASYLIGQTPRMVVAYLRIAEERGLGTCDPFAIPTYLIEDGTFKPCERLSEFQTQPFLDVLTTTGSLYSQLTKTI